MNSSWNPIFLICKTVSNSCDFIFHDLDILVNIVENRCTQEKTDIRYYVYLPIHFEKKRKEYDKSFQLSEKKKSDLFVSMEGIMPESENIT